MPTREAWRSVCDPDLLAEVQRVLAPQNHEPVAVALSGGADSAMLALHAACAAREAGRMVHAFHIHHGLQADADRWQQHSHGLAAILWMPCHSLRVEVAIRGDGMESAARDARYRALAQLARATGVSTVLLAHHQDDQAETVLLRLLRGAGPLALGAMSAELRRDGLCYRRPWLDQPRERILQCASRFGQSSGWWPVEDPSNADMRYTRAALRQQLAPVLDERWPAWKGILARHAAQSRELAILAEGLANDDWAALDPSPDNLDFSLAAWRGLAPARQVLVLRHWLGLHGLRAPSAARLNEWLRQLRGLHALGHDRQMRLRHEGRWIVCVRGRVLLESETQVK